MNNNECIQRLQRVFQEQGCTPEEADLKAMAALERDMGVNNVAIALTHGCTVRLVVSGTPAQVKEYLEAKAAAVNADPRIIWAHHPENLRCLGKLEESKTVNRPRKGRKAA